MAKDEFPFKFEQDDVVIFSCTVIPTPISEANRNILEKRLLEKNVRIFRDVHVSGHAAREDQKDFLNLLKPKHYVPTHGGMDKLAIAADISQTLGYELNKTVHILQDGKRLVID